MRSVKTCKLGSLTACFVLIYYIPADLARRLKRSWGRAVEVVDEALRSHRMRGRELLRDAIEGTKAFASKYIVARGVRIGKSGEDGEDEDRQSEEESEDGQSEDRESENGESEGWDSERVRALASQLPEELFARILGGMVWRVQWEKLYDEGEESYTKRELGQCALVSTYWAPRCQARIFRVIWLRSAQDVRDLLAMLDRPGTQIANYIQLLRSPLQDLKEKPATPWLHLIPLLYTRLPFCRLSTAALEGQLWEKRPTLRTVHSLLSRTVPAHNTRLRYLYLTVIVFACFGDLVHLLDELRDLRILVCEDVTWSKGPPLTSLRSSKPRPALLEAVVLHNVPFDKCAPWLLTVYRAPPRTVRLSADDFLTSLRAFLDSTIANVKSEDQRYRFSGERDAPETRECRSRSIFCESSSRFACRDMVSV